MSSLNSIINSLKEIEVEETIYINHSNLNQAEYAAHNYSNVIGETYTSPRYGKYTIIGDEPPKEYGYTNIRMVKIKFENTGTERVVRLDSARSGAAKDPYAITIAGVGYLGEITLPYDKHDYDTWRLMLIRNYDKNSDNYQYYGAKGVTVCERWHCFANFLEDIRNLKGYKEYLYAKNEYNLDKDTLQHDIPMDQRVYSPDTCIFIKGSENTRVMAKDNKENTSSEYYGVHQTNTGSFQCRLMINGCDYYLGAYDSDIAAGNMYNFVLAASFASSVTLNDVEYMPIEECLSHKTRKYPIDVPSNVHIPEIDKYNASVFKFLGVAYRNKDFSGNPMCQFQFNKQKYYYGSFDSPIAAANAYNWYASHIDKSIPLNNLKPNQIMQPDEWLKHKCYNNSSPAPKLMVKFIDEPKEEKDKRCLEHYGMIFN